MVMLHRGLLALASVQVVLIGFLLSYFQIELPIPELGLSKLLWTQEPSASRATSESKRHERSKQTNQPSKIFSVEELSQYDGQKGSRGLYLAILGKIYDVSKGEKHYGPDGGYHFFAGRDATRAFVTGDFSETGLIDDVNGLSHQDLLGMEDWMSFYQKQYGLAGYLSGTYYDKNGKPTAKLRKVEAGLKEAHKWKEEERSDTERFPPCNTEWSKDKGSRVWCTSKSGGISRDWVGVPRKYFKVGSGDARCACVKNTGASPNTKKSPGVDDVGDLNHPGLQLYPNCHPESVSCTLTETT